MRSKNVPIVTVVIPVRNRKVEISKCLASVLDQTFDDFEVMVVDNNSTDGTRDIVKDLARKDPKVIYTNELRRGIGNARYKGEKKARGKVILMTDSDCEVPRNWIERMSTPVLEGSVPATQGLKHAIRKNYWSEHVEQEEKHLMWSFFERYGTSKVDTANFCIDRGVLKKVGYTDRDMDHLNDTELAARIHKNGYRVALMDTSVGHHNPLTLWAVAGKSIHRGSYHSMLLKKYPDDPVFEHHSLRIFLGYSLGLATEALKMDASFLYHLVSGISWRFGLLCGIMKRPITK
ncbi:MAG: glycosyltransferase family 2 protein [Candidatus Thermoplasmatota archaeon]|nr:glycosyltransferase family 2 protein [Candidatus Thermoplasmatota archaeon]